MNPKYAYLQTPAVRAKRAKAIRAAFAKRKKLIKAGMLPATRPEGQPPVIVYEGDAVRHRVKRERKHDKLDVVKGLLSTIALILEE